jgi:hemoglobin-like flavoprotein
MNAQQLALVQKTFEKIDPISQQVGDLFYTRLFEIDPGLRALFKGDMKKQALMLMTVIGLAVRGLNRPETIIEAVRSLGSRHYGYGVSPADYNTFGAALLWALEQVLDEEFTPEVKQAWIEAYDYLAGAMKQANNTESALG